jgi:NTP pyrophosphatase (non-canonical NTP hydrolase)
MQRRRVYSLIDAERQRQAELWGKDHGWGYGDCSTDLANTVKLTVLAEELGEVSRAVLEKNQPNTRTELIQVAAVAVAWLECLPERDS